jgi:hypothetical protein
MPLLTLIITLAVIGAVLWLITTYIPMEPTIRKVLVAVVVIAVVLWLLKAFGLLSSLNAVTV